LTKEEIFKSFSKESNILPLDKNILLKKSCHNTMLKGSTGRSNVPVWWTWSEKEYTKNGNMYMAELAMPDSEILHSLKEDAVVELEIPRKEHPNKFYRPTGLDSFYPETRFCPNISPDEKFGRTCPMDPADPNDGHPEAVSKSISYSDDLPDGDYLRIKFFKYE